jgi:DNA-binding protein YbaB
MTGPDAVYYSPDDEPAYEELARRASAAIEAAGEEMQRLAAKPTRGRSADGQVTVTVTAAGRVTSVRITPASLSRQSSGRLSDVVTRTVRATQDSAREAFEREAERLRPPVLDEIDRALPPPDPQ